MVVNTTVEIMDYKKMTRLQESKYIENFDERGIYRPTYNRYVFCGEREFLERLESIGAVIRHTASGQGPAQELFPPRFELISGDWTALHKPPTEAGTVEDYLRERADSKAFLLEFFEENLGTDGTYSMPKEILDDNEDIIKEMEREGLISRPYKTSYPQLVLPRSPT